MPRKKASKRYLRLNTPAEEARIQAGIAQDPENPEITAEQFSKMRPYRQLVAERRRGRPKAEVTKEPVTVRLDPEIVAYFRETGPGWQTRLNAVLADYVKQQRAGA
jgi:uncharacterized protein (DUF4415 family)